MDNNDQLCAFPLCLNKSASIFYESFPNKTRQDLQLIQQAFQNEYEPPERVWTKRRRKITFYSKSKYRETSIAQNQENYFQYNDNSTLEYDDEEDCLWGDCNDYEYNPYTNNQPRQENKEVNKDFDQPQQSVINQTQQSVNPKMLKTSNVKIQKYLKMKQVFLAAPITLKVI